MDVWLARGAGKKPTEALSKSWWFTFIIPKETDWLAKAR